MRQPEALPPDIAKLLERGALVAEPPSEVRERLRSRLSTTLTSPVASPVAQLRPIARGAGSGFAGGLLSSRVYVGALAGFVVGAASMWAWRGRSLPEHAAAPAPVVTTSVAVAPAPTLLAGAAPNVAVAGVAPAAARTIAAPIATMPLASIPRRYVRKAPSGVVPERVALQASLPVAVPTGSAPTAPAPLASTPTSATSPSHWGLLAEGELLQKGRTAMVRGDTEGALAAVEEHANRFPQGKLVEERQALRIQVLVAEDRTPEARLALGAFERDYPRSLLGPALEEAVVGRVQ